MSENSIYQHGQYKIPLKFKKSKHIAYYKRAGELNEEVPTEDTNNFTPQMPQKKRPNTTQRYYNIENVKNALEVLNENYDTFRTIFKAPDDINVNYEIQQEAAGLILDLFNPNIISNPIRIHNERDKNDIGKLKLKGKYQPSSINNPSNYKSYIDYRYGTGALAKAFGQGFDEDEFNKHRGCWNKKNIEDFKELFDD